MTPTTNKEDSSQVDKTKEKDSSNSISSTFAKVGGYELLVETIKECSEETREEIADKLGEIIEQKEEKE